MRGPLTRGRTLDHAAAVYDWLSPLMLFGQEERISRRCLPFLEDRSIKNVLDIGCGTGTLTISMAKILAARNGTAIGLDAAPKMIDVAVRKSLGIKNVDYKVAAAENLPFPDRAFDYAVSTFFYHHIDFDLKISALNETYRVLKPGGFFVMIDVDVPTNTFGSLCSWAGYYLFHQEEIRENIKGKLRLAMESSSFTKYEQLAHYQGYISVFKLVRP